MPFLATGLLSVLAVEDLDVRLLAEELVDVMRVMHSGEELPPEAVIEDLGVLAVELAELDWSPADAIDDLGVLTAELSPCDLAVGEEIARSPPNEGECVNEMSSEIFCLIPCTLN